jgi:hypothetical protein
MRSGIRLLAFLVALVTVVLWFFGGPNLGWTKTSVPIKTVEEATGLDVVVWEKRFLPGVDFLAGGLAAGAALCGLSFCFAVRKAPPGSRT